MKKNFSLCDQLGINIELYDIRDNNGNILYIEFNTTNGCRYWEYIEYGKNNFISYIENNSELVE